MQSPRVICSGFAFLREVISTSGIYIAYIDGLNLSYKIKELNRINKINLKYLDIRKFIFETVDSDLKLDHIKYFTYFGPHQALFGNENFFNRGIQKII